MPLGLLAGSVFAEDVTIQLESGARLIVKDSSGTERFRFEESTGELSVTGTMRPGDAGVCDPATAGAIRWKDLAFEICNGQGWIQLASGELDGSTPINATADCPTLKAEFPSSPDGVYWLDPDSFGGDDPFQHYCDNTHHGGGWTLVLNLNTGDTATRGYTDTAFWEEPDPLGDEADPFPTDFKSRYFSTLGGTEIMLQAGSATVVYALLPAYVSLPLQSIFATAADTTITGPATAQTGSFGGGVGDLFLTHGLPIIINSTYAYPGTTNLARLGAIFDDNPDLCALIGNCIGTNFGGWGGRYRFDTGAFDWQADYEGAPYHRFCPNAGYGSNGGPFAGVDDAFDGCDPGGSGGPRLSIFIR